jgi:hypothetical protein
VYAIVQERGSAQDLLDAAAIRGRLLDPTLPPLPAHVLVREMEALRSILPQEALDSPDADIVLRLGASGMFISATLYGDPAVGRVNQIIGDLERPEYRVPATYHNSFGLLSDGRLLQQHLGNIGARPHERIDAAAADTYSDAVYGNGRRSDNPDGYDELRSAVLARAHALALGLDPVRADRIHEMISGTAFDQATKAQAGKNHPDPLVQAIAGVDLQTLAQPAGLEDAMDLIAEDLTSARFSPARVLGRVLIEYGLRIRTVEEGLRIIDEFADYRPLIDGRREVSVREAVATRITGNAGFTRGHQYPPTWTLDNPGLRATAAAKSLELAQKIADRQLTAIRAYEEARRHAAEMRAEYGGMD